MRVLITNDDGIESYGIKALTKIVSQYSDDIWVVSTDRGNSGMSHAITMHAPIFIDTIKEESNLHIYRTSGTPVDCVKVAIDYLMKDGKFPDMILSGINHGANTNASVIYSGTLGAATEGAFYRIPSIGFSYIDHNPDADISVAVHYTNEILKKVIELPEEKKKGLCLNVNIPDLPMDKIKGIKFARQNRGCWREDFIVREDPRGRKYVWMRGKFYSREKEATDTDDYLISEGYVSIVPVRVDMTDYERLDYFLNNPF